MTALRRLIKPKRLKSYLDLACGAFDGALAVAVRAGDPVLAASGTGGEELDPGADYGREQDRSRRGQDAAGNSFAQAPVKEEPDRGIEEDVADDVG